MDIDNYWKNRGTVRSFSDRAVETSVIYDLLDKAAHAPTTGNMQLYSVVVTVDKENKEKLLPAHFSQPAAVNAPVLLTFCADYNRFTKWCVERNASPSYGNFQSFVAALLDTALLAQQFNTLAELNGLGCCYLGTTTYNAPQIAEILELPDLVVPVVTLAVGYPSTPMQPSDRIASDGFIHLEKYHPATSEDIDRLYSAKESLPESQNYVKENNKETLAQVFTDIRYNKKNNEFFSKVYSDFIKKQGF